MDRQLPLESAISGGFNLSLGLNIDNHTDKGNRQSANNNAAPKINLTLERLINQGISLVYALNNLIRFSREYSNKCVSSNRRVLPGSFAWAQWRANAGHSLWTISQILSPIYKGQFSDNSFGFRT